MALYQDSTHSKSFNAEIRSLEIGSPKIVRSPVVRSPVVKNWPTLSVGQFFIIRLRAVV